MKITIKEVITDTLAFVLMFALAIFFISIAPM